MAAADVIDFERLLRPISDDQPAGSALRNDPAASLAWNAVRLACQTARDLERKAVNYQLLTDEEKEHEPKPDSPKWAEVVQSASELLAEKSKDLWIAAWLLEGLVRTSGFAGLRDGFRLVRQLCDTYWDSIHPRPDQDEDGLAHTVSQLSSLNDTLTTPILRISLIPASDGFPSFSSADYIDAAFIERMTNAQERSRKIERGCPTTDILSRAVRQVPVDALAEIREEIDQAMEEFTQLSKTLDDKCGTDSSGQSLAPLGSRIESTLSECRDRMRDLTREVLTSAAPKAAAPESPGEEAVAAGSPKLSAVGGEVWTRAEAFQFLLKVSDFFRRTEPHSPVSYALEQAVRWGKMSLPELMKDLIPDDSVRGELFRRTGILEMKSQD
jgi:type VI secretion system protein ImpA